MEKQWTEEQRRIADYELSYAVVYADYARDSFNSGDYLSAYGHAFAARHLLNHVEVVYPRDSLRESAQGKRDDLWEAIRMILCEIEKHRPLLNSIVNGTARQMFDEAIREEFEESGRMGAIKMARKLYGLTAFDAKQYVEDLCGRQTVL